MFTALAAHWTAATQLKSASTSGKSKSLTVSGKTHVQSYWLNGQSAAAWPDGAPAWKQPQPQVLPVSALNLNQLVLWSLFFFSGKITVSNSLLFKTLRGKFQ